MKTTTEPRQPVSTAPARSRPIQAQTERWTALQAWVLRRQFPRVGGYLAAGLGVAALTWLISLVLPRWHIANISMTYLLLVLALAATVGSGPAILASVLSFLAFDWFFVPPVGRFTVDDPSEWLALFLFLVVASITSQLAGGLRRSADEARRRGRETATLYGLSMAILGDARLDRILPAIADQMRTTLGLRNVAIFLQGSGGAAQPAAESGEPLSEAERRERELSARWVSETRSATQQYARPGGGRVMWPVDGPAMRSAGEGTLLATSLPIILGGEVLGIVATVPYPGSAVPGEAPRDLLHAFVAQTALAVGRARLAEEEEKARAAAESERMKSTFLASVSHDLRTPLTAIKAAADGLRQDAESRFDEAHRELATSIDREVARLDRLVGNLLEISRIESGGLPLRRAPEDLSELVGSVAGRLASQLADRRLSVSISEDLPLVSLDAVQIERVLTNLLENAVKFSPAGSAIQITAGVAGTEVWLRVHNSGSHLPEQERERVFDKFYRLSSGDRSVSGVGLGLAICRGIVEAHSGHIWAENESDGVTFIVRLPLQPQVAQPAPARSSE